MKKQASAVSALPAQGLSISPAYPCYKSLFGKVARVKARPKSKRKALRIKQTSAERAAVALPITVCVYSLEQMFNFVIAT